MKFMILKITKENVFLSSEDNTEYVEKASDYDLSMIKVGQFFEADTTIPYNLSSQRRQDIRDYRQDEADNDNI